MGEVVGFYPMTEPSYLALPHPREYITQYTPAVFFRVRFHWGIITYIFIFIYFILYTKTYNTLKA